MLRAILCLGLLGSAFVSAAAQDRTPPWADGRSRPGDLEIRLATFGAGGDILTYFGHSGLIVEDAARSESRIYDYGTFRFGRDTLPRYLMGQLLFWVAERPTSPTLERYRKENRSIHIQTLNLTDEETLELARFLAMNALPENREYLYHHYRDNCTTRIRDAIDMVIGGQLRAASQAPARMTLRDHTRRFTHANVLVELLLMYWMNDEIDQPITVWDEMFLPSELEQRLGEFEYVDSQGARSPLVRSSQTLFESNREPVPAMPALLWPATLLVGILLGGVPVLMTTWRRRSPGRRAPQTLLGLHAMFVGTVYGLPALVLFLLAAFTEHTVTYWNENLLLANPLTTLALPLGAVILAGKPAGIRILGWTAAALSAAGLLLLVLKLLPAFDQANSLAITLILPVSLGMLVGCRLWPFSPESRTR